MIIVNVEFDYWCILIACPPLSTFIVTSLLGTYCFAFHFRLNVAKDDRKQPLSSFETSSLTLELEMEMEMEMEMELESSLGNP